MEAFLKDAMKEAKMAENKVNIDGVEYNWDQLSDRAKELVMTLQAVNAEINRLKNLVTFCELARASYADALKREITG